jgi:hypothetical protein
MGVSLGKILNDQEESLLNLVIQKWLAQVAEETMKKG